MLRLALFHLPLAAATSDLKQLKINAFTVKDDDEEQGKKFFHLYFDAFCSSFSFLGYVYYRDRC